jgi:hypothetical protein
MLSLKSLLKGKNVPEWIKRCEMYKNRENYEFERGNEIYLQDLEIENIQDFKHALKTIKFWNIESPYPYEIWEFIFEHKNEVKNVLEKKNDETNKYFLEFLNLSDVRKLLILAIKCEEINLIKYLEENDEFEQDEYKCDFEEDSNMALKFGTLEIVMYLYETGYIFEFDVIACESAAQNVKHGLEILKWLRSQNPPCPWNMHTCAYAAGNENNGLEILKWLRSQDPPCPWEDLQVYDPWDYPWDVDTCSQAAGNENNGLEILKWLRSQDPPCSWDEITCNVATGNKTNGLEILKWVRSQDPPCPWGQDICLMAVRNDVFGLEMLKWLRSQDPPCPWDERTAENAVFNKTQGLEILKWMRLQKPPCPWDKYTCELAKDIGKHGKEIFEWIREQDDAPC